MTTKEFPKNTDTSTTYNWTLKEYYGHVKFSILK